MNRMLSGVSQKFLIAERRGAGDVGTRVPPSRRRLWQHDLSITAVGLILCCFLAAKFPEAAADNGKTAPSPADVRALWKVDKPLYKELLSEGKVGLAQHGAIMWGHLINQPRMTEWALRNGVPYSLEEVVRLHGEHKLNLLVSPAGLLEKLDGYREWHKKYGVNFTLYAFYYTKAADQKYHYLLNPEFTEESLHLTAEALEKAGDMIALVFTGDEQIEKALRDGVKLFKEEQKKFPKITEIDRQVKDQFGFGKYGIPTSERAGDPFRRLAFARWTLAQMLKRQQRLHAVVRKANPKLPIVSADAMTGIAPFAYAERAPWVDIFTGQDWIGEELNASIVAACAAKVIADTTEREVWPACHINRIGESNRPGPEELREFYSVLFVHGVTGFHVYTPDNFRRGKPGDTITFYFGDPERWRAVIELVDRSRELPPLRFSEPEYAVLYSNDAYQASLRVGSGASPHIRNAFAFLSPVARSSFRFIDETNLSQAKLEDLARYKAIIVPFATISRKDVPKRLLDYVKAGGTLVCADPEAFSFDLDGSDTSALREELLAVSPTGEGEEVETELRLSPSLQWRDLDVSQPLPVLTRCLPVQPKPRGKVLATFADRTPAIVLAKIGRGRVISFAFNPFLLNPFARERRYISDAVFQPVWQNFFRALLRGLGIKLDQDVYRFRFPPFKTVYQPEPKALCLTGNYVQWKREEPVTEHNARVDGRYTFSVFPDEIADVAEGMIPFAHGKLTDRIHAAKADPAEGAAKRVVEWNTTEPFDLALQFQQPCRPESVALIYSGALPDVTVSGDDGETLGKAAGQVAGEDVRREPISFEARAPVKGLRLHFGPRPVGESFTLAEIEVWGKATGKER